MLDLSDELGRRKYERTLMLTALYVLRQMFPNQRLRPEHSIGRGILFCLPGLYISAYLLDSIDEKMREVIQKNYPIEKRVFSKEDAIEYFENAGRDDKVKLLKSNPTLHTVLLCGIQGVFDDCYGDPGESTGEAPVFSLISNGKGFILQMPSANCPERPAAYISCPKHQEAFNRSMKWCDRLKALNAADLTEIMQNGEMREFIRVNEALHDSGIADIAREIVEQQRHIVFVAGPSSSGKTTFAARLGVHLRVLGKPFLRISMDDYYLDRDLLMPDKNGKYDFETIEALDIPLMQKQLSLLLDGKGIDMPKYDFHSGKRGYTGKKTSLSQNGVLIVEGIHALNPKLSADFSSEQVYRVFVSALTVMNLDDHNRIHSTDVRLLRRIVRDYQYRGTMPADTLKMWADVRAGEERWIFPYQENADSVFNTALHYELPVLKTKALPLLLSDECKQYPLTEELVTLLGCFDDFDDSIADEIPPLSLLREFIGGCTAEKK